MEDKGTGRLDRIKLWKNTHYKDTKGWIHPVAEEKYKEMVDIQTTQQAHVVGEENTTQRENAKLCQVVHNLQSQNERILALLKEIIPGATTRIDSPRVPTTPHSSSSPSSPDHESLDDH
ncbi:Hypothetical predicted protein [Olea europaea subsp. europaea]|uniref:Uncharacterized protein n=1 Tax=Olea europaea subsp. europaea TaxID=158383 RepID=A0A8S0VIQ0_OLEEU|nr:Hypothetical predicted protein [Olea europaea subsp. europaea]